ncbi:hypothetical protein EJ04DRAFT_65241 [Polyplosphaeria fusca]|uniref:Uncharacterized protein n=1 Tax=Polyplosphaeria fusca TaxID=682080 RepID=A0A9P4QR59_9PLEO|nr:hypothetical protein EJ04DRAFT_65241 [Polyplosphaeria fusca]
MIQQPQTYLLWLYLIVASRAGLAPQWTPGDKCPDHISTIVPNFDCYNDCLTKQFGSMVTLHSSLITCPNIQTLDLRLTMLGCTEFPDRWNFPFKLEGGDSYPSLQSLRLEGYHFTSREWSNDRPYASWMDGLPWYERLAEWIFSGRALRVARYSQIPMHQRNKTNMELWLDAMDWSKLETLALLDNTGQDDLLGHAGLFPALRDLDIFGSGNLTTKFIQELQPNTLVNLTWTYDWSPEDLYPVLACQGSSLRRLEMRSGELYRQSSPALGHSQVTLLSQMAPGLEHLSINLRRNGTFPLEILESISAIPSLSTLDLWLDILSDCRREIPDDLSMTLVEQEEWREQRAGECAGEDIYQRPFVNSTSALDLFNFMRDKKVGDELRNVTFWVGDWSRPWIGALYIPDFLDGKRAKVSCSVEDKIGSEAQCTMDVGNMYWNRTDGYW